MPLVSRDERQDLPPAAAAVAAQRVTGSARGDSVPVDQHQSVACLQPGDRILRERLVEHGKVGEVRLNNVGQE